MNKNISIWHTSILCVLILGSNIYLLTIIFIKNKELSTCVSKKDILTKNKNNIKDYFLERNYKSTTSEGLFVSDTITVEGLNNKRYRLLQLIDNSFSLIFRFDESNCKTCVETEIERLKEYIVDIDEGNVLILVSGMNVRDVKYFKLANNINFAMYLIAKTQLNLPLEEYNIPYIFLLSSSGLTRSVFIPELYEKRFSDDYYEHVKKLMYNSQTDCTQ